MRTLNNEMIVTRGETFTMDKLLQNKDGSPYIISNQLVNPRWVITISSNEFEQSNRYLKTYILPMIDYPTFYCTNPIELSKIFSGKTSFKDVKSAQSTTKLTTVTIDNKQVQIEPSDYVYYGKDANGHMCYKYAKIAANKNIEWYTYECRLTKVFASDDTSDLTAQTYLYSISLVDDNMTKPILLPTKLTIKNKL